MRETLFAKRMVGGRTDILKPIGLPAVRDEERGENLEIKIQNECPGDPAGILQPALDQLAKWL